jgi:hypothetical protein
LPRRYGNAPTSRRKAWLPGNEEVNKDNFLNFKF